METLVKIINDPAVVELMAGGVGFLILLFYAKEFYKDKTYELIDPNLGAHADLYDSVYFRAAPPLLLTSKVRYWFWFYVFFFFLLVIWLVFFNIIKTNDIESFGNKIPAYYAAFPQLFSALLISSISTKTPIIGNFLKRFREFAHARASIPSRATAIFDRLKSNEINISELWRKRVANDGENSVKLQFFKERRTMIEAKWASIVYMMTWIEDRSSNAKSSWAKKLSTPDLGFHATKKLIGKTEQKLLPIIEQKTVSSAERDRVESALDFCLSKVSQLVVCLVFSSTVSDSEADKEFRSIGINVAESNRTELDVPVLVGSATILAIIAYGILSLLGLMLVETRVTDDPGSLSWRANALIMATLVLAVPAISAVMLKHVLSVRWSTRSEYGSPNVGMIMLVFPIGFTYGILLFLVIDKMNLLGEEEGGARWPYALLCGGAAMLSAIILERRPFVWEKSELIKRTVIASIIGGCLLGLLSFMAVIMGSRDLQDLNIAYAVKISTAVFFLGAFFGLWLSMSLDYSNSYSSRRSVLRQEIDRYLVGKIGYPIIRNKQYEDVQSFYSQTASEVPHKLKEELLKAGLLEKTDSGEALTELGHEELYLVATTDSK